MIAVTRTQLASASFVGGNSTQQSGCLHPMSVLARFHVRVHCAAAYLRACMSYGEEATWWGSLTSLRCIGHICRMFSLPISFT